FDLTATDGERTICLQVRDTLENESGIETDTITLDRAAPESEPTIAATVGPLSTDGANTDFIGTASDATSGVASVQISIKEDGDGNKCLNAGATAFDAVCPIWHDAVGTTAWTLTLADSLFADGLSYE